MSKNFRAIGGLDTPYKKARQIWDDRLGSALRRSQLMTHFAFLCAVTALISTIITLSLFQKPRVVPYIVEVDSVGKVSNYGRMLEESQNYSPSLAMMRYHVVRFISDFREISSDVVVLKKNGYDAFTLVTQRGAAILTKYIRKENPLVLSQNITRDIRFLNFLEISANSYTASWKEITYNLAGETVSSANFRGTFVILQKTDMTEEDLFKNPSGLYIDTFAFAEDRGEKENE